MPDDPRSADLPSPSRGRRSPAVVAAELAETRRYLAEAPPHHGAGTRDALQRRVHRLERELETLAG